MPDAVYTRRSARILLVDPEDLGAQVAFTSGYANLGWSEGTCRDDFYFLRVPRYEADVSGFEKYENEYFVELRWWSVDELATRPATSAEPIELPWRH